MLGVFVLTHSRADAYSDLASELAAQEGAASRTASGTPSGYYQSTLHPYSVNYRELSMARVSREVSHIPLCSDIRTASSGCLISSHSFL